MLQSEKRFRTNVVIMQIGMVHFVKLFLKLNDLG